MALGKYNRRTVLEASGEIVPGATVNFYVQETGLPAMLYNDADGLDPIGTSIESGPAGEIEVFVEPGKYRITVSVDGDIVEEITYEPIVGDLAVSNATDVGFGLAEMATPASTSFVQAYSTGLVATRTISQARTDLSINNVDNTSDLSKPISTATQTALDLKKDANIFGKIAIYGSSVALGTGATPGQGYADLLETALTGQFTMVNLSEGGNDSQDLIDRFYTDLVPESPNIVFIGLSLANEGLAGSSEPRAIADVYIRNLKKLINMCENEGYKVVIGGLYPNGSFGSDDYQTLKATENRLQDLPVPYVSFLGALDNGSGDWRTGLDADADHPNDAGHLVMFNCIELSLFNNLFSSPPVAPPVTQVLDFVATTAGINPMVVALQESCESLTVAAWIRRDTGAAGQPIVVFIGTGNGTAIDLRVANQVDNYVLRYDVSNLISSAVASSDGLYHHLVVTFLRSSAVNELKFYIDGVLIGTDTTATAAACTSIYWGSRDSDLGAWDANGYQYGGFNIWKTILSDEQVLGVFRGNLPRGSLILSSSINIPFIQGTNDLPNLAQSDLSLMVAGDPDVVVLP